MVKQVPHHGTRHHHPRATAQRLQQAQPDEHVDAAGEGAAQ